jgi:hypothetical protein
MAFDAESKQTLDEVVDRAVSGFKVAGDEIVAKIQAALQSTGEGLIVKAQQAITAASAYAAHDVQMVISELDGWTLTIAPITIRLNRPQAQEKTQ